MGDKPSSEDLYRVELERIENGIEYLHQRLVTFQPNDAPSIIELLTKAHDLIFNIEFDLSEPPRRSLVKIIIKIRNFN